MFKKNMGLYFLIAIFIFGMLVLREESVRVRNLKVAYDKIVECVGEENIESHIKLLDAGRTVTNKLLSTGDVLIQYQTPNAPMGMYFATKTIDMSHLGINDEAIDPVTKVATKREVRVYKVTRPTNVLVSRVKLNATDTWSIPNQTFKTLGGGEQYFSCCRDCFQRIN